MARYCFFDRLPVEILYNLFTYFGAHEILFTFSNVSSHVDAVLLTYSDYQLDFKAILKSHFDLICKHIRPDQVISLTVSDETDTPGQSALFFSRFQIEEFTQLKSLTLLNIELESLSLILPYLNRLHRLRSFTFNITQHNSENLTLWDEDLHDFNRPWRLRSHISTELLPQLNRLNLSDHTNLKRIPLPHLIHLHLSSRCSLGELQAICHQASKIKSLNVLLIRNPPEMEFLLKLPQLTRLTIKIKSKYILLSQTKIFARLVCKR